MSRRLSRVALVAVIAVLASPYVTSPVLAGTLDSKKNEWSFDINWNDTNDVGSTTNIDGEWQYIFGKGYNEVGALVSYLKIDPDAGSSADALIIGPAYTFNWMPEKNVTPYLTAAYGFVSGDLGDFADDAWQAGVGAKVFVGDSAAVKFELYWQRLNGSDGFDDSDSHGVSIGISIFTGKK